MAYSNMTGLPSVTDIIRPYINSDWFTEESSKRGSAVHASCAAYLLKLYAPPLQDEYRGYFESFKRWADAVIEDVILVEKRLIDEKLAFCGKPDMVVKLKGDKGFSLPDIKTGQATLRAWQIQSAAYRHLARVNGIETSRGFPIRLKEDGSGILPIIDYSKNIQKDFNVFQGLLNSYKFFHS